MKKIFSLIVFAFLLISCTDNDDKEPDAPIPTPANAGSFSINNVPTGGFARGYIIKPYTGDDPSYDKRRFYVVLTDGEISMVDNELVFADNVHNVLDFNLYTDEDVPGAVQNTTYNLYVPGSGFDMSNPFIDHSALSYNVVLQNGEFVSGDEIDSDDMAAGLLNLTGNNGVYSLSFQFTQTGFSASGTFVGPLIELNYQY